MKTSLLISLALISALLQAQVVDFESLLLEPNLFLNGSDGDGNFMIEGMTLPNDYNAEFMSWSGWSISSTTDTTTPGFTNQYSAITGAGNNTSRVYATASAFEPTFISISASERGAKWFSQFYITNTTYSYLSMRDGDGFAKRFGGELGNDPDSFGVKMQVFSSGALLDSQLLYLANFTDADNTMDFISNEWMEVNIPTELMADSLVFTIFSSDVGQFGINTPATFCIDDILLDISTSNDDVFVSDLQLGPNPFSTEVIFNSELVEKVNLRLFDVHGQLLQAYSLEHTDKINTDYLAPGSYIFQWTEDETLFSQTLVKTAN